MQVTGAVSWRREGLRYKKNEVFLDIVESINVLMTAKGACSCLSQLRRLPLLMLARHARTAAGVILRSDVTGKIQMKCFLSVRAWPGASQAGAQR
jgi:hypothetical protein